MVTNEQHINKHQEKAPRQIALCILNEIEETEAFAEPLLDKYLTEETFSNPQDKGLLTQLVYGTLRMQGHLDWVIGRHYRGRLVSMEHGIRNILRIALYQLLFTDRIPDFAAVNEAVTITKKKYPGREALVNAILRNYIRKKEDLAYPGREKDAVLHIAVVYSHPQWLVKRWIRALGAEETIALCRANNEIPPGTIRVNSLQADRETVMANMNREGFGVHITTFSPDGLTLSSQPKPVCQTEFFQKGEVQLQDEASQLIAYLVNPQPGQEVLDICAGTGGKATHLAALMKNSGRICAMDINKSKIMALKEMVKRMGVTIMENRRADATGETISAWHGCFDRILVDVPCSGLGTLRRNPEIKWRLHADDIKESTLLQKKIISNAATYLKRGGLMIYSTCTLMPEENEEIISDFLSAHRDFSLIPPASSIINKQFIDRKGYFRTYPHHYGTDGFFGAVLVKKKRSIGHKVCHLNTTTTQDTLR